MFMENLGGVFSDSFYYLWSEFMTFVPHLLEAIVIFIIGWIVASVVGKLVRQLIDAIKLNKLFESAGAGHIMEKAGMRLDVALFIGGVVKWAIILIALMAATQLIGLTEVASFLSVKVLYYLGSVLIAILILIIGFILADAVKKLVIVSSHALNVRSANFLGSLARYAVIVFAFAIALPKILVLDSDTFFNLLVSFVTPLIWGVALALALAFGLGGKDIASRAIEKFTKEMSGKM
jgi:hypothetical protein